MTLILKNISEDHREKILALLQLYSDIIACDDYDLGHTGILKHSIDTGNAIPICQQVRRLPLPAKEKVTQLLKDMIKKVILPSKSPWASPIVLVQKNGGSTRYCVDYWKVNEVTKKDAYLIPSSYILLYGLSEEWVLAGRGRPR